MQVSRDAERRSKCVPGLHGPYRAPASRLAGQASRQLRAGHFSCEVERNSPGHQYHSDSMNRYSNALARSVLRNHQLRFASHSEVVVDVRLEPARHAGVNLRQAGDRGVVEAHRAVVLVGEILEGNSNLQLAARGRVVRADIGDTKCRLFNHRQVREVEPESRQVVAVDLQRSVSAAVWKRVAREYIRGPAR